MHRAQDEEGDRLGMWLFLYGELLLFGGLFLLYAVYLSRYAVEFGTGSHHLDVRIGAINTVILLVSSFCVASAFTAIKRNSAVKAALFVGTAILMAGIFLVNKYHEWSTEFGRGLYPGGAALEAGPAGEKMFFGLYYTITGLHGVHVAIGAIALSVALRLIMVKKINQHHATSLDLIGLYWHLVDLIWIFVFPLFYLIT